MKLQILQENLERAIGITTRFASTKAQLPILGNILLSTKKSKIYISSTNLEISASVQIGAKVEEEGEISIPAKVIADLVSNLPKETINLESEKEQLKISTPGFSSTILGMDPSDFPAVPNSVNDSKSVVFSKKDISECLNKVVFATSTDETRPILTGVLFILKNNSLSLVATDGFRLSRRMVSLKDYKGEDKTVVIPKSILGEIIRGVFETDEILFNLED
ncbi:MAG: polymerase III subunit beta protein, partial [Candidatus Woesebacteria bacterium GW2011_GWB1_40_12]